MGSALATAATQALGLLALLVLAGCGTVSADQIRAKDELRKETAKKMPGEKVPLDPADE
ncbi:MAG: hypothetical protein HND42_01890 [Armatimonadetes bacterium]|nr:hypothetical protein [Armatimonadota bacterium]